MKSLTNSLNSGFCWRATFVMLYPWIPKIDIFEVNNMVSINVKRGHKCPFLEFWAFMETLKTTSDIGMLGIPGLSIKNVAHQ